MMQAEIVAIGTELTTGAKLDTNSQWLSIELSSIGIEVEYHTSVADTLASMVAVLASAASRSDLVLITGGLGPTLDDLTRQALADLAGVDLIQDDESLEQIRRMFARRGRDMPERNRIQAMFPQGAQVLLNPIGTAPGIWMELTRPDGSRCRIAAFPGVPSEMKRMYHEQVVPRLPIGTRILRRACINCFGIGESDCEQMLGGLTARGRNPEVGITVHEATITLRINAAGTSIDECESLIEIARREAHARLGNLIFSEGDDELEHIVLEMLAASGATLATIESGTGGLLAHRLTDVPASRECYRGGLVVPPGGSLAELLQLTADETQSLDETSEEMALRMAHHCRDVFRTDFAIAITACPDETDPSAPAPTAHVAVVGGDGARVLPHRLLGDTTFRKSRAAKTGLNLLRLMLMHAAE